MDLTLKIPGQVMLTGEFAVLFGGTAIMMPVPRFIKLTEMDMVPDKPYSPFIQMAFRHPIPEIAYHEKEHGRSHVIVDAGDFLTTNPDGFPLKLGLGLSAAEATGIVAFRFEKAGKSWTENRTLIFKHALEVHQKAQQFLASGADVACCSHLQPVKFKLIKNKPSVKIIERKNILYSVPLALAWTGQQSNTRESITQFKAWVNKNDEKSNSLLNDLIAASHKLADSWFISPNIELFKLVDEFTSVMTKISEQAGIPYHLPIHVELDNWARQFGGRAKPTGAGGGNMVLLMGELPINQLNQMVIPLNTAQLFAN
jgi:mevalonate kinase